MRNCAAKQAEPISTIGFQATARHRALRLIAAVILMVAATSWLATAARARGMGGGSHGSHSFSHGSHSFAGARSFGGSRFHNNRINGQFFIGSRFHDNRINGQFFDGSRFQDNRINGSRFLDNRINTRFFDGSRFHDNRINGQFSDFPFGGWGGWGWGDYGGAFPNTQLAQPAVTGEPPPAPRPQRYEPPTVETTPSGVTIVRGPGSRHS